MYFHHASIKVNDHILVDAGWQEQWGNQPLTFPEFDKDNCNSYSVSMVVVGDSEKKNQNNPT